MLKRTPQGGRDRASPGADFYQPPVLVVAHDDAARVARQTLRRSRGNAEAVVEDGPAVMIRIGKDGTVDMDDNLEALAGRAWIHPVMERRLSEERQRVCPLLLPARRILCRVRRIGARLLIQRLAGGFQRPEERAPTSGASLPRSITDPSSSCQTLRARNLCCRTLSSSSDLRSIYRQPRTMRSTWTAVPMCAIFRSRSSVSGVATRVTARTFE